MTTTDTPPAQLEAPIPLHELFGPVGLNLDAVGGHLEYPEWLAIGPNIQLAGAAGRWWAGDWLAYGNATFTEVLVAAGVDADLIAPATLSQWAWVSRKVPQSIRRKGVIWSIHRLVAELDDVADMDRALRIAERDGHRYRDTAALVRAMKTATADRRAAAAGEDMPGRPSADEEFPTGLADQWPIPDDEPAPWSWGVDDDGNMVDTPNQSWTPQPTSPTAATDSPVWRLSWALPPELADLGPEVAAATEAALRAEYARLGVDPDSLIAHEWPHHNDDEY